MLRNKSYSGIYTYGFDKVILGTIRLEPISEEKEDSYGIIGGLDSRWSLNDKRMCANDKKFKPYYVAHTKIQTLALLNEKDKGSNWYYWGERGDSNPRPPGPQPGALTN